MSRRYMLVYDSVTVSDRAIQRLALNYGFTWPDGSRVTVAPNAYPLLLDAAHKVISQRESSEEDDGGLPLARERTALWPEDEGALSTLYDWLNQAVPEHCRSVPPQ